MRTLPIIAYTIIAISLTSTEKFQSNRERQDDTEDDIQVLPNRVNNALLFLQKQTSSNRPRVTMTVNSLSAAQLSIYINLMISVLYILIRHWPNGPSGS